jgi:hypothetical protein
MEFFLEEALGNARFTIKIHQVSAHDIKMHPREPETHYYLDSGCFCIGGLCDHPDGMVLSIRIPGQAAYPGRKYITGRLRNIGSSMMLQILEILEAVKRRTDMLELETMALALYSSSFFLQEPGNEEPIDFRDAYAVYLIVQEWKNSTQRIEGTFNQYKPADMTRHRFVSVINQLYNCSATQLIYDINMQKAMNMLLDSDESIIMVSELSGYTKKENFITAFRNTYGVTPGYLRKQFR